VPKGTELRIDVEVLPESEEYMLKTFTAAPQKHNFLRKSGIAAVAAQNTR
jgi:hypothetical protein